MVTLVAIVPERQQRNVRLCLQKAGLRWGFALRPGVFVRSAIAK